MAMDKSVLRALHVFLIVVFLGSCASSIYFIRHGSSTAAAATAVPTRNLSNCRASDSLTDTAWSSVQPGLERRVVQICDDQNAPVESVYIWRLDQNYFRFDVDYHSTPQTLEAWQSETNALIVLNGGYYSIENQRYFPDGLTVVNGQASGQSFSGFGGMLAIKDSGAELRWLVQKPYDAYESLHAALQAFPILVEPGGRLGFGPERDNKAPARRTVIAQDRDRRILLIVTPQGYFTLHRLSVFLTESDFNLDIAVNLDGGGSTGILISNPHEVIPSTRPIPFVILVYPR
jgi:hypothetical protein